MKTLIKMIALILVTVMLASPLTGCERPDSIPAPEAPEQQIPSDD